MFLYSRVANLSNLNLKDISSLVKCNKGEQIAYFSSEILQESQQFFHL